MKRDQSSQSYRHGLRSSSTISFSWSPLSHRKKRTRDLTDQLSTFAVQLSIKTKHHSYIRLQNWFDSTWSCQSVSVDSFPVASFSFANDSPYFVVRSILVQTSESSSQREWVICSRQDKSVYGFIVRSKDLTQTVHFVFVRFKDGYQTWSRLIGGRVDVRNKAFIHQPKEIV